jgi:NAD(P)-dependent dehydrogenase (short-subunit alcohol dehydrogenase family)
MPSPGSVLVVGGTRGLGAALVDHYSAQSCVEVYATHRGHEHPGGDKDVKWLNHVDLMHPSVGENLVKHLQGVEISTIYITAGIFIREEFDKGGPDWDTEVKTYHTSAIAPPVIIHALVKANNLIKGAKIVLVSSEAGSITLRTEGGGDYAHHGSKAALNMVGKQLSYDLEPLGIAVGIIHPSFMRTEMTKGVGFDVAYDEHGALKPEEAAEILSKWTDNEFDMKKSGEFWAPRGTRDIGSWNDVYGKETQKEGPVQLPW